MVTAQDSQFQVRVMKIFTGLGAKNVTISSIPEVTFFMDEIVEGYTAKCAVKCETASAWVSRDAIYRFYQAMQSYMPYSGMKRGYFIATGAFMKDAKVKAAEINAERDDVEIILVNGSDLDQYEVKEVEVPVEVPKKQKKRKQAEPKVAVVENTPTYSQQPIQPNIQSSVEAEIVEEPKQKMKWLAKKVKSVTLQKQNKEKRENPLLVSVKNFASNNPIVELGRAFASDISAMLTDLPFGYLLVFVGLAFVIIVAVIIMLFHSTNSAMTVGRSTIFP